MKSVNLTLDDWQEEILNHNGDLLLCTGRQVGKSTIFSLKAAKYMLEHKDARIIMVSITEDQAKLLIVMILDYLERNYPKLIDRKGKRKPTTTRIYLKNGSNVIARPVGNTGDAVRGFTGDVLIIDEAARMPELAFEAAKPTLLTTGGQLWVSSTPKGKQGFFYESFLNRNERFKVFHKSSVEVIKNRKISPTWTEEKRAKALQLLENERADMSMLQFGQEYEGKFMEDIKRYFEEALIQKICTLKRRKQLYKDRTYSLGVDIARMGEDESTFEVLDIISDKYIEHVENIVTKKTLTTQTEDMIRQLNVKYDFDKIYIDAGSGSLGVGIFDQLLRHDDTKRKVVAINNRARALDKNGKKTARLLKEDLYDNLKRLMERGWILLLDDDEIALSLRSVQYEYIRQETGEPKMRIYGDYTHIVEGLIRAAWHVKEKLIKLYVSSIRI